ncbi:MAG: ATP-binding protein [Asticcacaulis sp.]
MILSHLRYKRIPMTAFQKIDQTANRKNLGVLINLRGIAFCAQIAAILLTYYGLNIVLPVSYMIMTAAILVGLNLYSLYRLKLDKPISNTDLFAGLVIDVLVLSLQLHFSGGTYNPFVSFFMLPVIIGAVMLDAAYAWAIYVLTLVAYLALAIAGLNEPMPAMAMPGMEMAASKGSSLIDRSSLHMHGMMLGYGICAGALVFMITRVRANLRVRDAELEGMKAAALEESHLVRMGLLSTGAAHELGTPLTTVSVILQDWHDLPLPRRKADLMADIETLQAQIERCKTIVSDILASSGDSRGEGASVRPLKAFITDIVHDWQQSHPDVVFESKVNLPDTDVVAERVIQQALTNIFDNAREAALVPDQAEISFDARLDGDNLHMTISDKGKGFEADILSRLGQPYVTTKGTSEKGHGRGLGLFLVSNTLRKLGGTFKAENRLSGHKVIGADVILSLPLSAIRIGSDAG